MTKELHLLQPGEKGIVVSVNGGGSVKRRIVDMGMVGGTAI